MERRNLHEGKGVKPPDPKNKIFALELLTRGGKSSKEDAPGKEPEAVPRPLMTGDDDGRNGDVQGTGKINEDGARVEKDAGKPRNQFPVKLEFKLPRNVQVYNCAAIHKEWFEVIKRKDPTAKLITYKETAMLDSKDFPRTQEQYNRSFPQRITRQPGQPRAAEVVFEIESVENFQTLKTYNPEMMQFLLKRGVYMKMNVASARRRDAVGYFTHVHPRATWRVDLQEKIVKALKANMSAEEIDDAMKAADDQDKKDMFITLNFKKQYIQSEEGLIQTETLEIQSAPEIKESINKALFKASTNGNLPGKYYPYGISRTLGQEEYRKILKRQNAFLAGTHIIGVQGLTEEILDAEFDTNDSDGNIKKKTARELITAHYSVIALEKTNLTTERGKYSVICKRESEKQTKEFLDELTMFINASASWEIKHITHPEIRRSSSSKWSTQIQEYAASFNKITEDEDLPRNPPKNAWNKKIVLINEPEEFPALQPTPRTSNVRKVARIAEKSPNLQQKVTETQEFEEKIKEIEERINKSVEEKINRLEQRCSDLEKSLTRMMEVFDSFAKNFSKSEERAIAAEQKAQKISEIHLETMKSQFQEQAKDLRMLMLGTQSMEVELTETKKRNIKGKEKTLKNQDEPTK
jgi:hypothetical protein